MAMALVYIFQNNVLCTKYYVHRNIQFVHMFYIQLYYIILILSNFKPETGTNEAAQQFFAEMTQEQIEQLAPQTFAHCYVQGGGVVYVPAGSLVCEKAVTAHNLILRATSTLLCESNSESCSFVAGACGVKILGLFTVPVLLLLLLLLLLQISSWGLRTLITAVNPSKSEI